MPVYTRWLMLGSSSVYYVLIFTERECEGHSSGAPSLKCECDIALNRYRICMYVIYSYNPGWVWYPCYYTSPSQSWGWVLITRISYECTWVITGLLPKRLYQSMLSLWTVSNGFRLCSPIKASFGTNNLFLWFFSRNISTYRPRTDIYLSVLWLVISDISQYKTLWCMASLGDKL